MIIMRELYALFEEPAVQFAIRHALTMQLPFPRRTDASTNGGTCLLGRDCSVFEQRSPWLRHFYQQIKAIEQRTRQPFAVATHLVRGATAIAKARSEVATRAELRCLFAIPTCIA